MNAHHPLWYSSHPPNTRDNQIAKQIGDTNYGTINEYAPTRVVGDTTTSPDVTIAHPSIINTTKWSTITALSSDHLPIVIELHCTVSSIREIRRTYINFTKADWPGFTNTLEEMFNNAPHITDVHTGESLLRKNIIKSAKKHIPAECIRNITPNFPSLPNDVTPCEILIQTTPR